MIDKLYNLRMVPKKDAFDIYIISSQKDLEFIERTVKYIRKNIEAECIYVVTKKVSKELASSFDMCVFLDEDRLFDGLFFDAVKKEIAKYSPFVKNTGWYFQQFLKYACAFISKNRYYLIWDADTIPVRKIDFYNSKGQPYFNLKREYMENYFFTIFELFSLKKSTKESFVSEHMLFDAEIVKEMCSEIMLKTQIPGNSFWRKILYCSFNFSGAKDDRQMNFSEYETYGTYCDYRYPKKYAKRKLKTLRFGTEFLGDNPSDDVLSWAGKDFDTISFEHYGDNRIVNVVVSKTEDQAFRGKVSFKKQLLHYHKSLRNQMRWAFLSFNKKKLRELQRHNNYFRFDFVFGNSLDYSKIRLCFKKINCIICHKLRKHPILFNFGKKIKMSFRILVGRYV